MLAMACGLQLASHLDNVVHDGFEGLPLHLRHIGGDHHHLGSPAAGVLTEGVQHHLGTDRENHRL